MQVAVLVVRRECRRGVVSELEWAWRVLRLLSLPHLFPQKCIDVSDVAEYLSKKYRAGSQALSVWKRQERQVDRSSNLVRRQCYELSRLVAETGRFLQSVRKNGRGPGIREGDPFATSRLLKPI
jgi:hypothetical protein